MSLYAFTVNPKGASVTVNLKQGGATAHFYFDQARTAQADGAVVASPTTFYVAANGTYELSLQVAGEEWATRENQPRPIDVRSATGPRTYAPWGPFILGEVHSV